MMRDLSQESCLPIWEKSIRLWRLTAGLPGTECAGSVPVQKNDEVRAWKRITVKCFLNIWKAYFTIHPFGLCMWRSWMPRTENWDLGFSICRRPWRRCRHIQKTCPRETCQGNSRPGIIFCVPIWRICMPILTIWHGRQRRWRRVIIPSMSPTWESSQKPSIPWLPSWRNGRRCWRKRLPECRSARKS